MTTKALSAAAKKKLDRLIKSCVDSGFRKTLIAEAGGEDEAHAIAWEVVANDVRYVGDVELSRFLAERALTAERAAILAAHLARHLPPEDRAQYLPRWWIDVDTLVYRALPLAPATFATAEASYEEWAKLGLAFVRWRRGQTISSEHAERIVTELARSTARDKVLGRVTDEPTPSLDAQGEEVLLFLRTTADVRRLAEAIAPSGGARFDEALAEATRENAWSTISSVEPVLRAMPRAELLAQLAQRGCIGQAWTSRPGYQWTGGASTYRMDEVLALFDARLAARTDTPSDLFADAQRLARDVAERGVESGDPLLLAMVLVVSAAQRLEGSDVPGELEAIVSFTRAVEHAPLMDALVVVLRSLPAARVHAWIESILESDPAAVAALAAHYDDDLLGKVLSGPGPIVVEALAVLGARALPTLTRMMNAVPAERAVRVRHAFVFALVAAAAEKNGPPEALDLELLVAAFDGRPMEREPYGNILRTATERIVLAMPAERRKLLLTAAYEAAPMSVMAMLHAITDDAELTTYLGTAVVDGMVTDWILRGLGARAVPALLAWGGQSKRPSWVREQAEAALLPADFAKVAHVFLGGEKWRAIEKDVAAAIALVPNAPRVRVYLVERASPATPAREGSLSRLGGSAHGLPAPQVPRDDDGEELTHILTLDLDDAPELRARYPR
ncbi:MAG: hypothetical protein JWM74_5196, partial [Myxococcaceae bacterium]|nr:hypothetical protein [Myxococcaceae bacterium]